jgi:hypothetical protein
MRTGSSRTVQLAQSASAIGAVEGEAQNFIKVNQGSVIENVMPGSNFA